MAERQITASGVALEEARPRIVVQKPKMTGEKVLAWGLVVVTVMNLAMIAIGLAMMAP